MGRLLESLKYLTILFQIRGKRIKYIKSVFDYRFSKHPKKITFPKMKIKLHGVELMTRENTQDPAFLSILYERELTKYFLESKPNYFVDVGAHIGRFSILLAKKGSKVFSIEPGLSNYSQLSKNIKFNNLKNIETLNAGCSDKEEIGKLTMTKGYTGQNTFLETKDQDVEKIKLRKLDNVIKFKMTNKDIIKIDVEGFEIRVLKGMKNILKFQNPTIIAEISDEAQMKEVGDFLKKFNYRNILILDERNYVYGKLSKQ